jgi:phage baseplate assembly protein W
VNVGALVNEQDTPEDIIDCIKGIIAYPIGTRHDMPEFGIPDLLFKQQGATKIQQLRDVIVEWEERAQIDTEGGPLITDQMIWDILVKAGITQDA